MSNLNDLTALALPSGSRLIADATESRLSLSLDGQPFPVRLRLDREANGPIQLDERFALPPGQALWAACYWLFARDPACQQLIWQLDQPPTESLAQWFADQYRSRRRVSLRAHAVLATAAAVAGHFTDRQLSAANGHQPGQSAIRCDR